MPVPPPRPASPSGGRPTKTLNIGFWNFYRFYNSNKMLDGFTAPGAGDDICYGSMKLAAHLRGLGHQVNTLDLSEGHVDAAVFLDHPTFLNSHYRKLRNTSTKLYLMLMENEVNRPDNWWKFNHRDFEKVFTWDPTLADHKKYVQFFHVLRASSNLRVDVAAKNKFCVLVASQKYSTHRKALYKERVDIIRWFERTHPDKFDLYGQRWDRFYFSNFLWRLNIILAQIYRRRPTNFHARHFPSHRGAIPRKYDVMKAYKFAMVHENAVFPGYLTEKIFDAFLAGCVPVYLGAPDVLDYIPAEAFVDRRHFSDNEDLFRYLSGMSQKEYLGKVRAIEDFINGDGIKPFTADRLIDIFMKEIVTPLTA